jgi:hypothetical protein
VDVPKGARTVGSIIGNLSQLVKPIPRVFRFVLDFGFRASSLFRVSCFGFRVSFQSSLPPRPSPLATRPSYVPPIFNVASDFFNLLVPTPSSIMGFDL